MISYLSFVVCLFVIVFFFKQKTAYEMRISDWSSDVCSSDLIAELIADGFQLSRYNPHQLGQRKVTNLHQELTRPQIWDIRCGEPCSKTRSSNPRLYLACLTPSILSAPLKLR